MDPTANSLPLSLETLEPLISTTWLGKSLLMFDQLPSTNKYAMELVDKGSSHGTVVIADAQTAGKGRFGREWHSPANLNINFSIILGELPSQSLISWIPLATGIAMAESIEEMANIPISLKWPNDLLVDTKKVGGILSESSFNRSKGQVVVVGVGINVNCDDTHFSQELREVATSLAVKAGHSFDRHTLLGKAFSKLEYFYERVWESDLSTLHSRYTSRCTTLGRNIRVRMTDDKQFEGFASSIGNEGELHVIPGKSANVLTESHTSSIAVRAGDVFHLR